MREISSAGDGLLVFINCDYLPGHHWMSFSCWYSINKNLPDARVIVAYKRGQAKYDLFHWTRKCKVRLSGYTYEPVWEVFGGQFKVVVLPPHAMAARSYDKESVGPVDVKEEELCTFVTYSNGCGRFNTSDWINRLGAPFFGASRKFRTSDCTVNELRVLELWDRMYSLFSSM